MFSPTPFTFIGIAIALFFAVIIFSWKYLLDNYHKANSSAETDETGLSDNSFDTFIAGTDEDDNDNDFLPEDFFPDTTTQKGNKSPIKRALLVGINRYDDAPLRGCVNDSHDIIVLLDELWERHAELVKEGYQVRVLLNKKATAANIKKGLVWLLKDCQPGFLRFFGFSGHGTGIDDTREEDGYSETLCPVNFDYDDETTHITDDYLYDLYSRLPNGMNFTMWLDCCHAWDDSRAAKLGQGIRSRSYPAKFSFRGKHLTSRVGGNSNIHDSVLVIGGCRADQTSADASFPDANGKLRFNGALTYFLLQSLRTFPTYPMRVIIEDVRARIAAHDFDQIPQLIGSERLKALPFLKNS